MKLKNINGTSESDCKCGSWLDHWKKFSGQVVPSYCPARRCQEEELVGAHVQKGGDSTDKKWYIFPLCQKHNKHTGELDVSDSWNLVSANKQETCEAPPP